MPGHSIVSVEDIDRVCCGEIPDENSNPLLFNIIKKSMIHGPCGQQKPDAYCMKLDKNGIKTCSKGFPKPFVESTTINPRGFPIIRRRQDGRKITVGNYEFDNRNVVSYNPSLCEIFNTHINVEVVTSVPAIKYMFKYVFKGSDHLTVKQQTRCKFDEIFKLVYFLFIFIII